MFSLSIASMNMEIGTLKKLVILLRVDGEEQQAPKIETDIYI